MTDRSKPENADWLILIDGIPETETDPFNYPEAVPDPFKFFNALCREIAGVEPGPYTVVEDRIEPREERVMQGFQGTELIGVRFTEYRALASAVPPTFARHESYGLPEMEIVWEYFWDYAGQAGHSIFRHRKLEARFTNTLARTQFGKVWFTMFGKSPSFGSRSNIEK